MQRTSDNSGEASSYEESLARWSTVAAARDYPSTYGRTLRDRRELRCIERFVEALPRGSQVLDLPCGTGRLTPLLRSRGLRTTGADCSPWMVEAARRNCSSLSDPRGPLADAVFEVRGALETGFADRSFDAVVCNRLFHHFRESSTRAAVFRELGRICRGPILVSFFNSFALDAVRLRLKHWWQKRVPADRIPIPLSTILADARAAGLEVVSTHPVLWGLSPMWYVVVKSRVGAQSLAA